MKKLYDARYLRNPGIVEPVSDVLFNLGVMEYDDNDGGLVSTRRVCVPAQELQKIAPYGVQSNGIGHMFADPEVLIPYLLMGIQELHKRVTKLESKPVRRTSTKKEAAE